MKKLLITLLVLAFLLAGTAFVATAQSMQARTYVEQTHVSPKVGTAIGYTFQDHIEVGGFFQRATEVQQAEYGRPLRAENQFYGAYFAYPLMVRKYGNLKFNVRTGVSNGQNFVITPSLLANFQPMKNLAIGGGIGTRAFRPTAMATITLRLNANNTKGYLASR